MHALHEVTGRGAGRLVFPGQDEVARPDLLLVSAFLHDVGKGWPGDHSAGGEAVARDLAWHRIVVRSANVPVTGGTALAVLKVASEFGDPPGAAVVAGGLRRVLDGGLDIAERSGAGHARGRGAFPVPRSWTCSTW